jgi:hypothetical protein
MAVKLPATVADQHDFIYAYKKDVTKTTDGKVKLNFRHALAQIAFQAKSKSRGIYVEIQKVELANIIDRGTVTFGGVQENETSDQYKGTGTFTNQCTWSNLGTDKITPAVALTSSVAVYPGISSGAVAEMDPVVIKDAASTTNGSNGAMFAIPQSVNAWDGTGSGTDLQTRANGSMYFLVWAKIRNVADATNGLKATDTTYLWGDANNFKAIGVKIDTSNISAWAAGKKYIYTFIFGQDGSNGGIDPANPDNPVLVPITYDTTVISVDDWADGGNQNIDMKK